MTKIRIDLCDGCHKERRIHSSRMCRPCYRAHLRKVKAAKLRDAFESIICLCAEGQEVHRSSEIYEMVIKEAMKGLELCGSPPKRG